MQPGLRRRLVYVVYLLTVGGAAAYAAFVVLRAFEIYRLLKTPRVGVEGRAHRADPELGWSAVPGAQAALMFPIGPSIPLRYDAESFRVPAGPTPPRRRPYVLALGCSFTHGDGIAAEETFCAVVARELGGTCLNAGQQGYGLTQVQTLARRLIPRYRPDIVLAQYSSWLVERGQSPFGRSSFGRLPKPFFTGVRGEQVLVQGPLFRAALFDLPFADYGGPSRSLLDFGSFLLRAGGPLLIHDDLAMGRLAWRRWRSRLPRPGGDPNAIERAVYAEIARLSEEAGSRMVVVHLSLGMDERRPRLGGLVRQGKALIADAQSALNAQVADRTRDSYRRMFCLWRGTPPVLVDSHPNPRAHALIAETILAALARAGVDARALAPR